DEQGADEGRKGDVPQHENAAKDQDDSQQNAKPSRRHIRAYSPSGVVSRHAFLLCWDLRSAAMLARRVPHSAAHCTATNRVGMMKRPTVVAPTIPPRMVTPIAWPAPAPAPVAIASGRMPKMKPSAVISTARSLCSAPDRAALAIERPSSRRSLANSTIRIAFFEASPIKSTMAICA